MNNSLCLLSAQVHFLDTRLVLIHIPLHLYPYFIQPVLQLILPAESTQIDGQEESIPDASASRPRRPWVYDHPFVNVSLTPVECSVVCSNALAKQLFEPVRDSLDPHWQQQVSISKDEYVVIQVDGEGPDAGQRVLELSSPLAMNGISIFFISTYFSDYILVPVRSQTDVINALEEGGFAFSKESEGFVNVASPLMRPFGHATNGSSNSFEQASSYFANPASPLEPKAPGTPPPSSAQELETRTFAKLKQYQVIPRVEGDLKLIQCAGRKDTLRGGTGSHSSSSTAQQKLQLGLVKCLTTLPRAQFISVTLTDTEPASILLEKRLLQNFDSLNNSEDDEEVLLGNKEDALVPIILDLRNLPVESTGIVCGIAGRLVGYTSLPKYANRESADASNAEAEALDSVEMSYLSTAKAGSVMVAEVDLEQAMKALKGEDDPDKQGLPVDEAGSQVGAGRLEGDW